MRKVNVHFVPLRECAAIHTAESPASYQQWAVNDRAQQLLFVAHLRSLNHSQRRKLARKVAKIRRSQEAK